MPTSARSRESEAGMGGGCYSRPIRSVKSNRLPTGSLYAEVLRRSGLFEVLQREYHVVLTDVSS